MSRQRDLPDSGIGRRDFLRVFGGSIATAASTPLSAVVVEDDVYINRKLGLAFSKPTDWSYASLRVFRELRNEYELATSDPVLVADFEEGGLPLAVISERSLRLGLSGSITVGVEPFDIEPTDTVQSVFTAIIERIPAPVTLCNTGTRALIFDSIFDDISLSSGITCSSVQECAGKSISGIISILSFCPYFINSKTSFFE